MKTPTWEPSSGNLLAFLNGTTSAIMADLYTFTLTSGAVYRFTSGDVPLTINGHTFLLGPRFERSNIRWLVGIEVDTLTIDLFADDSILIGSAPIISAIASGLFDNATVLVERAFFNQAGACQGTLYQFGGVVQEPVAYRGHAQVQVVSSTSLLNIQIPTAVYQPGCRNTWADLNCKVAKGVYLISKAATSTTDSARSTFSASFTGTPAATDGYLSLGVATCTSGQNAGVSRTIKTHAGGAVTVIAPWPYPVAVGDNFNFYPGCDKTQSTCQSKFNNLPNFAAEPYIPQPETVM
jgi:uncharacterized phage protein (TIGR02218 family)